jgi:hypothetical protein
MATWLIVALAPSCTLITPVPLAASPVVPLEQAICTLLTVTFGASMLRQPVMFSQLMDAPALVTWMVRVALPLLSVSVLPGHWLVTGPVLVGPGQPQDSRWAHRYAPPCAHCAGSGAAVVVGVVGAVDVGGGGEVVGFVLDVVGLGVGVAWLVVGVGGVGDGVADWVDGVGMGRPLPPGLNSTST